MAPYDRTAPLAPRTIAGVAYRAEHDHVGVHCGIMDQMSAALARPGHALLLECASLVTRHIPIRGRLLLVDTGTRHELRAGALNERRAECEAAVARLKVELPELVWLASWPTEWLARLQRALPEPLRSRALHVVGETGRTRFGAELLERGQTKRLASCCTNPTSPVGDSTSAARLSSTSSWQRRGARARSAHD